MLIDAHAHLDDERFDDDREAVIAALADAGVAAVLNAGSDMDSSAASVALAHTHTAIYAAVGVHPHEARHMCPEDITRLSAWFADSRVVAIGEIGLDYHYDYSPRDVQRARFDEQLSLAVRLRAPVVIHTREALGDTLDILAPYTGALDVMIHGFSGSWETAKICLDRGYMLSLGGPVTFKNARTPCEVARLMPLDRLLIETDAPYLTPAPHRGKRNWPGFVGLVCHKIAELKGLSYSQVAEATSCNAKTFFGIV